MQATDDMPMSDADLVSYDELRKEIAVSDLQLRIALAAIPIKRYSYVGDMRKKGYKRSEIPLIREFLARRAAGD